MPQLIDIDDPSDPRIGDYRSIRDRDLAGRHGAFVAEGEVVLDVLIRRSRFRTRSVLVVAKRLDKLAGLLALLPDDVPVFRASQTVVDQVGGFHLNRGILAIGERETVGPDLRDRLAALPAQALVVGLIGLANHDNVGGIFRNAAAFGADFVVLDAASCDPLYRKAIRVSVGAALTVGFARAQTADDMIGALEAGGFQTFAFSPHGQHTLAQTRFPARTALLFGAEGPGLPATIIERTSSVRIPITDAIDSLNVATTSGIALHHAHAHAQAHATAALAQSPANAISE